MGYCGRQSMQETGPVVGVDRVSEQAAAKTRRRILDYERIRADH